LPGTDEGGLGIALRFATVSKAGYSGLNRGKLMVKSGNLIGKSENLIVKSGILIVKSENLIGNSGN
jgi:hypothetical protein